MGHVGGRRFSVGELHAVSKTSSANGPYLNVWDFDISAAEFPQQKKTRVFGVNRPSESYRNSFDRDMPNDLLFPVMPPMLTSFHRFASCESLSRVHTLLRHPVLGVV